MHPWPILLIPFVVIVSLVVVLVARSLRLLLKGPKSKRVVTFPRALLAVSITLGVVMIVDYRVFEARERKVSQVVSAKGGEIAHISAGWPGTRYTVWFERPLGDQDLEDLAVLKLLTSRNGVTIVFRCEMTPRQLESVRNAFPKCEVITPNH